MIVAEISSGTLNLRYVTLEFTFFQKSVGINVRRVPVSGHFLYTKIHVVLIFAISFLLELLRNLLPVDKKIENKIRLL